MNAVECRDGAIDARELHHDETIKKCALAKAAKAPVRRARNPECAVLLNEFEREFGATPILIDDGCDPFFRKRPYPAKQRLIRRVDELRDLVEIAFDILGWRTSGRAAWRLSKEVAWRRSRFHGMFPLGIGPVIFARIGAAEMLDVS